jgi:hypothetical protein
MIRVIAALILSLSVPAFAQETPPPAAPVAPVAPAPAAQPAAPAPVRKPVPPEFDFDFDFDHDLKLNLNLDHVVELRKRDAKLIAEKVRLQIEIGRQSCKERVAGKV